MRIPIFVSAPTRLTDMQEASRKLILRELDRLGLEARALGRSDYPTELPLREVLTIARHCAGGIILGFQQFRADSGVAKAGTEDEKPISAPVIFPTEWNQLEAGILFSLGLPLLVFREKGISGGVFDQGVTDVFVHPMPRADLTSSDKKGFSAVLLKWQAEVRNSYYR
jgi:hypothetical protein